MTPDWSPLDQEMARWQDLGLTLPLWWRDDDAIAPTQHLERLIALSERLCLPVHLAVIPSMASQALAHRIAQTHLRPVVHGWTHTSHAPLTEKKAEFGAHRPAQNMLDDALRGLATLQQLFAGALVPMFVPPWNRIAPEIVAGLPDLGYAALSTYTPRTSRLAAPGLVQINTHLDPIHWKASRSLVPAQQLVDQIARDMAHRRTGHTDNAEPYGILTHHLIHDDAIWAFTDALITRLLAGPATTWIYQSRTTT
ncbi:polysaccharide deacetylase family protein [Rhodobacteraceae bacterium M382]|nr:polysaccharide deacetylase family protein [Rhodobacteraceae bacterium M382]